MIEERGFVYGTTSQNDPGNVAPQQSGYSDYISEDVDLASGEFKLPLDTPSPGTTYYFRAFAKFFGQYKYGQENSFTTPVLDIPINGYCIDGGDVKVVFTTNVPAYGRVRYWDVVSPNIVFETPEGPLTRYHMLQLPGATIDNIYEYEVIARDVNNTEYVQEGCSDIIVVAIISKVLLFTRQRFFQPFSYAEQSAIIHEFETSILQEPREEEDSDNFGVTIDDESVIINDEAPVAHEFETDFDYNITS